MTTNAEAGRALAWSSWTDARRKVVDIAGMLWAERTLVLGLGSAICALGLVAALAAPDIAPVQSMSMRAPIMSLTLAIAAVLSIVAGLSRALIRRSFPTPFHAARALTAPVGAGAPRAANVKSWQRAQTPRPPNKGKPQLVLVHGGA